MWNPNSELLGYDIVMIQNEVMYGFHKLYPYSIEKITYKNRELVPAPSLAFGDGTVVQIGYR